MRFDLVDMVIEEGERSITTVKNVTAAEEYLADHFPSFAVLPGVMMLEALVQAARRVLERSEGADAGPWVVAEVRNVRYGNMVRPGQQLRVAVQMTGASDGRFTFTGKGTVEEAVAVQGKFTLRRLLSQASA